MSDFNSAQGRRRTAKSCRWVQNDDTPGAPRGDPEISADQTLSPLSQAALETLSVIAYKQPITLPEIMEIRGIKGTSTIKTLLEKKLIEIRGRKKVVGRPILYGTTQDFLIKFGLNDLSELPSLEEFEELYSPDDEESALVSNGSVKRGLFE